MRINGEKTLALIAAILLLGSGVVFSAEKKDDDTEEEQPIGSSLTQSLSGRSVFGERSPIPLYPLGVPAECVASFSLPRNPVIPRRCKIPLVGGQARYLKGSL